MENLTQPTSSTTLALTSIVIMALAGLLFYFIFYRPMDEKIKSLERSKKYIDSNYLRKQGATSTYGGGELGKDFINYDLRSLDGGKNWYAIDYNFKTDEVKVLGEVETVYPKLLKHLDAFDKLTEYTKKNGGVSSTDDTIGIALLKDAGFTVVTNKEN